MARAVHIGLIHSSYYIHGPWPERKNFCCFTTARRNARIASAVLATAIPSVCLSVTGRYCVKTMARSTVQFALSDSKTCLSFVETKNIPQGRHFPPEILAPSGLPPPEGGEFWHILSRSASTARDRKRSSNAPNKSLMRTFQWDHQPRFYAARNFVKMG